MRADSIHTGKHRTAPRLDAETALSVRQALRESDFYHDLLLDHGKQVAENWLRVVAPMGDPLPEVLEDGQQAVSPESIAKVHYRCSHCGGPVSAAQKKTELYEIDQEHVKVYTITCFSCNQSLLLSSHRCLLDPYGPLVAFEDP